MAAVLGIAVDLATIPSGVAPEAFDVPGSNPRVISEAPNAR